MSRHSEGGFTLIETVVSMLLLAVMSVLSYQAVDAVLATNERSRQGLAEEASLQRAWQIIGRDIMHLRARPFVDGLGMREPAYVTDRSEFGVRFSRGGGPMVKSNPSGLRRVEYSINREQQLQRQSWAITQSPRQSEGSILILMDNVDEVVFEHLTKDFFYSPDWPPINETHSLSSLPKMIRVTITVDGLGESSRLFPGLVAQ
ncbi:type II secretion system minor pseudopilin GspJ [SAR92 clade bacterium H231]|jgi:general secretion pathway protein J|nr:type II secretion system minor pseudopilin GspJ [SAR92 clade bacterium H231]MDA7753127.1 type II secretion system minor pseudopilin GspJ [bacterium]MDA7854032.1 type II secretion system minor pseudopilin GspJ [Porticoccaceae bacterium]MDA8902371.1 type II secretion system minor pseudopilin GspJ [Porticoccaceae bacterium]MDA8935717.1 type II secretion system minor pseudopilin GspJ [Porticoccaceae bacterium]